MIVGNVTQKSKYAGINEETREKNNYKVLNLLNSFCGTKWPFTPAYRLYHLLYGTAILSLTLSCIML